MAVYIARDSRDLLVFAPYDSSLHHTTQPRSIWVKGIQAITTLVAVGVSRLGSDRLAAQSHPRQWLCPISLESTAFLCFSVW